MRDIPAFEGFVQARFERCLDLYMCPRARISRVKMDPQALIPKLPRPEELRPFPSTLTLEYKGHTGNVRSISLDPRGQWIVSGGDDGTVRLWEVSSARCFREWKFDEVIECVAWNPNPVFPLIAVAFGTKILILDSHTGGDEEAEAINTLLAEGRTTALTLNQSENGLGDDDKKRRKRVNVDWHLVTKAGAVSQITQILATAAKDGEQPEASGEPGSDEKAPVFPFADPSLMSITTSDVTSKVSYRALVNVKMRLNRVVWHHKGDYFASVSPKSSSFTSVLIHRISQSKSQTPFTKNKGLIQGVSFHPTKPFFFVASQRNVRIYNLQTQMLVKKLLSPAKWISSLAIHPSGDHVLIGSYDRRVCWFDLDLASTPHKTLKYHTKAVRQVQYHSTYPLFATCSDDGNVHVFHCKVFFRPPY
jgi:ribosome biogenesis protein ERB1